jgi:hypothetical protein
LNIGSRDGHSVQRRRTTEFNNMNTQTLHSTQAGDKKA